MTRAPLAGSFTEEFAESFTAPPVERFVNGSDEPS
jgi:hypothetical protein